MSDECIFCKICKGAVPVDFLYQDDHCVIFRDINPKATTHLLIVSKKHIPSIAEMTKDDVEIVGQMIEAGKNLAADFGLSGYRLQINVGKEGGQEIFHLHIHLLADAKAEVISGKTN